MKKEKCYVCGKIVKLGDCYYEPEVPEDKKGKAICIKCIENRVVKIDTAERSWEAFMDEAVKLLRDLITDDKKNDS
jgi:hypothetical protein